ncbi:MAG TPA: hypothetical protein VM510_07385 [Caulifigura sp.]|nr:hypothetical protein [Caulifigura sp.]
MSVSSQIVGAADGKTLRLTAEQRSACQAVLEGALREETGWNRIRAAEALIVNGDSKEAWTRLSGIADSAPPEERIGVWRALAQAAPTPVEREKVVDRIRGVFADRTAPDRLHAVETLAKLRAKPTDAERALAKDMASGTSALAVFPNWWLALAGDGAARQSLGAALSDADPVTRLRAVFAVTHLDGPLVEDETTALVQAARKEPVDAPYRAWIIGSIRGRASRPDDRKYLTGLLEEALRAGGEQRLQAVTSLTDSGTAEDRPLLLAHLDDADLRVRIAAATALLRIERLGQSLKSE